MVSLHDIQQSYGFNQAQWKVNGELLSTEKGMKRVTLWPDEKLARWHAQWRDRLAEKTGVLTNRMIQTAQGERILLTEAGWITLHDEVTSLYSFQDQEKQFGFFLGQYFTLEMDEFHIDFEEPIVTEETKKKLYMQIPHYKDNKDARFLEAIRKESLLRLSKANSLKEQGDNVIEPVVAPVHSLDQGKIVFEGLHWTHNNGKPEQGYRSLRLILSEWLERYGQASLFKLLDEVDNYFPLNNKHGQNLLVDCLIPWEFITFLSSVKNVDDAEEMAMWKEKLSYQWESSRKLVKAIVEWLDVTRERVTV
ncbi:hypothetical protein [Evansella cellulosilytica]|uniref:Uncharacterized protein n=1 Tax=Evansella cellulosilytica (strain ATCC 21833 / DSM 2522 / FERM P-1141 / JCM 9156 / N-4) TaxID=649639 RepID=E6TZQ8_EVAC2|nr:hypothetical protein [Evansella cellulosilytica]ADU31364.1 hypothetical protein Bcell_3121 [Evansella cellulosilytica DSM 2522]